MWNNPLANLSDLRRRLNFVCGPEQRFETMPRLILMSDDERLGNPVLALRKLRPGDGLILRHRDRAERRRLAVELRPLCRYRKLFLIVAADPRLAMDVGADGIHLAEVDVSRSAKAMYWVRKRGMIVTAAAHTDAALRCAVAAQVDGVLLSPVCATASHPGQPALGLIRFAGMVRDTPLAVYGLGGVDHNNLMRFGHTGMAGVAGIGAIVNSM